MYEVRDPGCDIEILSLCSHTTAFACDGSRSLAIAVAAGCCWATCPPALYRRAAAHCGKQTNAQKRIRTISAFISVIAASVPSEHEGRESSHRYEQMARLPILNCTSNVYCKRRTLKQQQRVRLQKERLCSDIIGNLRPLKRVQGIGDTLEAFI